MTRIPNDERGELFAALRTGTCVLPQAIPTGIGALDNLHNGGLPRGTLTVVAGQPGVGTSTFVLGIGLSVARHGALPTLLLAPDESASEVWLRITSAVTKVPINHLRGGGVTDDDRGKLDRHLAELSALPITVSAHWLRTGHQPLSDALADYASSIPLALVVADHTPDDRQEVRRLKVMAQRHNVAVVVTAKTAVDPHGAALPGMGDPCFAGGLADWADLIVAVHRPDLDACTNRPGEADIRILKHRHGATRDLVVCFQGHYARFVPLMDAPRSVE